MAWIKVPKEHHPLFYAALPRDPRVTTRPMFGGVAAMANGHIFGGLFARSIIVRLDDDARREALALDGAGPFDPMGNGRVMSDKTMMPDWLMDEPDQLRAWLQRALEFAATLPRKTAKPVKPAARKPTKPAARKATKPAARKAAKPAARKRSAKATAERAQRAVPRAGKPAGRAR